jgi:hypothetical protein
MRATTKPSPKLHVVPNFAAITFGDLDPLLPGAWGLVTSRPYPDDAQRFRVIAAHVVAVLPRSWIERLARRIPGVQRLLRARDTARRERTSAQLRIDHVAVGNFACTPDKCDDLPIVTAGNAISVRVTNTGDRSRRVHVLIEGVLS